MAREKTTAKNMIRMQNEVKENVKMDKNDTVYFCTFFCVLVRCQATTQQGINDTQQ